MDIKRNELDSPLNVKLEPELEDMKIRVMGTSTNLRVTPPPLTRAFASKNDVTKDILAKLRYNIKKLRDDHSIFDDDMNITEGRRAEVWTMMKQFLSQNPRWWKRLIEVAKCQAEKSIVFYPPEDALSDRDIIEDWVREMWNSSTDQSLAKESDNIMNHLENICGQIKSELGNDAEITSPTTMEESQNPGSTKMDTIPFPRNFRSRNPWTRSVVNDLMKLNKELPNKIENLEPEAMSLLYPLTRLRPGLPADASSAPARQTTSTALERIGKKEGSDPDENSKKYENIAYLSLQQRINATERQLRSTNKNQKKIKQDSILQECSRPKCQFPTRCFWTRIREQEANGSLYITNQCLTTNGFIIINRKLMSLCISPTNALQLMAFVHNPMNIKQVKTIPCRMTFYHLPLELSRQTWTRKQWKTLKRSTEYQHPQMKPIYRTTI